MTELDYDTARRLAYIRVLIGRAEEESRQAPPLSFDSISRAHDAVEAFLALAAQQLDEPIQHQFNNYWTVLTPKDRPLSYQARMQKFNKVRVNWKHYGAEPSPAEVKQLVQVARALIEDECPAIFGVELHSVNLSEVIAFPEVRAWLDSAQHLWENGQRFAALADLREAFDVLIDDYRKRKSVAYDRDVFAAVTDRRGLRPWPRETMNRKRDEAVAEAIDRLDQRMVMIGLGIDLRRYGRFSRLAPRTSRTIGGRRTMHTFDSDPEPSNEDFRFCRDFVFSSALYLQSFDYDLEDPQSLRERRSSVSHHDLHEEPLTEIEASHGD